jgi:hypothetical protein
VRQVGDQTKVVALFCALLTQYYSSDDIKDINPYPANVENRGSS